MDAGQVTSTVQALWEQGALSSTSASPTNPAFDPDRADNGYMEQATRLYAATAERQLAARLARRWRCSGSRGARP